MEREAGKGVNHPSESTRSLNTSDCFFLFFLTGVGRGLERFGAGRAAPMTFICLLADQKKSLSFQSNATT